LRKAWVAAVNDDGEEEASPLVYRVNVFVSTAHDDVLAFDDTTGKLPWAFRAINTQRFWRTCSPTTAFTQWRPKERLSDARRAGLQERRGCDRGSILEWSSTGATRSLSNLKTIYARALKLPIGVNS